MGGTHILGSDSLCPSTCPGAATSTTTTVSTTTTATTTTTTISSTSTTTAAADLRRPATQCPALHQESPACSRSPGRAIPSPRAPRRATTRASSGAPPWSTRLATMWLARDNMDSALKHVTRASGEFKTKTESSYDKYCILLRKESLIN